MGADDRDPALGALVHVGRLAAPLAFRTGQEAAAIQTDRSSLLAQEAGRGQAQRKARYVFERTYRATCSHGA
jgi:hypothetical protein